MRFKELEVKYDAANINAGDFFALIETMPIVKQITVSSYDDYFTNENNDFVRYRHNNDIGELTTKRKTNNSNNNNRIEVNLPTEGGQFSTVSTFLGLMGYKYNFGIYKTCQIYWTNKVNLVYYIVYDKTFQEKRRFIEIEANEDYPWESEDQAWSEILKYEKKLESLSITPQHRLKKSLFEIFYKPN